MCVWRLRERSVQMSREWDKKTGCRYFDLDVLCAVNEEGGVFRSFVDRYGTYVFKRAESFNARFQVRCGRSSSSSSSLCFGRSACPCFYLFAKYRFVALFILPVFQLVKPYLVD